MREETVRKGYTFLLFHRKRKEKGVAGHFLYIEAEMGGVKKKNNIPNSNSFLILIAMGGKNRREKKKRLSHP